MMTEATLNIEFSDELERIDFARVTALLADEYWCTGIQQGEVVCGAQNSTLVVGAYLEGELVGYLRVVSDRTRFAYIADVVVDERYQKQGIGQGMVRYAMEHERLKLVFQWLLTTSTAHGVYEKVGFKALERPENWMIHHKGRPAPEEYIRRSAVAREMVDDSQ